MSVKNIILASVLAIVVLAAGSVIGCYFHYNNQEISLRQQSEKCHLEEAKVLLCKRKLTTKGFLEQIKTREEAIADIENKIRQTNIEYNKFRSLL
jgi:septal ring factor EnvC (AmiA/AmiB activator)